MHLAYSHLYSGINLFLCVHTKSVSFVAEHATQQLTSHIDLSIDDNNDTH